MKRDLNYVAAVEKAISEKYGKQTVQDLRSTWEPEREKNYLNQLKERRMNRFECCGQCYIVYVEFREDRWKSGWRPQDGEYKPPFLKTILQNYKAYIYRFLRRVKKWLIFWT